jgi:hypothetical protein
MLLLTPVRLGPPCRRPILIATPLYQSRTWCTQRDARARIWRRTRTNPKESLRRAGRITLPRDRRHASMKREQAQYPPGTRKSGRVRSGKESFENMAYPDRAGAHPVCNGGSRALPRAALDRAGVSHYPMGFFLAFRKAPMLPFVLFYSVNNPS